jgi:hypothetical protein
MSHNLARMWFDDLPPNKPWTALWSGYVLCGCIGIRKVDGPCAACGDPRIKVEDATIVHAGREVRIPMAFAGAEGRNEDYVYLAMLEREWRRPEIEHNWLDGVPSSERPSPRAAIVILFWSYFETRVERLLRVGLRGVPTRLIDDTLSRYASVGARLDRLYRVLFDTTYARDLEDLGFGDIARFVATVQVWRNAFAHGQPRSIDDDLVTSVIENLQHEHEAWIAVFNRRVALLRAAPRGS